MTMTTMSWLSSLSSTTADPWRRLFVPPNVAALLILAIIGLIAAAMFVLRYRISRQWIDLRNTAIPATATPNDNRDKTVIITGGSAGLGYHVAYDLAVRRRFGTVVLTCRNLPKGLRAAAEIARRAKAAVAEASAKDHASSSSSKDAASAAFLPRVECIQLDLSSLASVAQFAREVKRRYGTIYAVVLNAGMWVPMDKRWKTDDGYEIHFGVNHLAHQLLAQLLLPHLQQQQQQHQQGMSSSSNSRIVWVASSLLRHGQVRVEDGTNDFVRTGRQDANADANETVTNRGSEGSTADEAAVAAAVAAAAAGRPTKKGHPSFAPTGYCDSKLMNALACRHLAAELSASASSDSSTRAAAVSTYAVCPGFCRTELGRYAGFAWWKKLLLKPLFWLIQRPPELGAQNIVYCCLEDSRQLVNGGLYRDGRILKEDGGCAGLVDRLVHDGTADRLWDLCTSLLKDYLGESK
jgi:NAD(P)-dependent dehydrogenase (short-subunit alcohol dehydrogenase family)